MAYVVTSACNGCKYTDCVAVCPCDCFREDERMLYIDPESCIDCDACRVERPVEAIFPEEEVPAEEQEYISLNARKAAECPEITEQRPPLASG